MHGVYILHRECSLSHLNLISFLLFLISLNSMLTGKNTLIPLKAWYEQKKLELQLMHWVMNQFGFDLPLKKASYKRWTMTEWKEKVEQYKFREHFVKSLVDLLHATKEGCQWVKKVLKE
jgi:hypothetical protein